MEADLYQRELRLQEDEIYRLEDYIEEYQTILRGARCEIADLQRELAEARRDDPAPTRAVVEPLPPPARPEPGESLLDQPDPLNDGVMPEIETPATPEPATSGPETAPAVEGEAPAFEPAPLFDGGEARFDHGATPIQRASAEGVVTPATARAEPSPPLDPPAGIDPALRLEVAGGPDPGVLLVTVSDRGNDTLSRFDGEASVMITDPRVEGRLRRVARWDYLVDEVRSARNAADPARLEFAIALPDEAPRDWPLRLWVRLVDGQQKRLQAVDLVLPSESDLKVAGVSNGTGLRRLPPQKPAASPAGEWRPASAGAPAGVVQATYEAPVR